MTQRSVARRKHTCKQLGTKLNLEKRRNTLISIEQSFWRKSAPHSSGGAMRRLRMSLLGQEEPKLASVWMSR